MFCSNCGNRVPDGSKFCSACGARLAVSTDTPAVKPVELPKMPERNQDFSFDWSSVKDEPQRKPAREVVSPWGSSSTNAATVGMEEPRSRTMSFIDILKKEREEKARAAEAETFAGFAVEQPAANQTEPNQTEPNQAEMSQPAPSQPAPTEPAPSQAAPSAMPSFYVPPMYDDLNGHTVTPYENMKDEEPAYVAPAYEEPVQEEPAYEAPKFETIDRFDPAMKELNINVEPEESTIVLDGSEFVNLDEESSRAKLDAELAAILDVCVGNSTGEEDDSVDLFEDTEEIDFPVKTLEQEPVLKYDPEEDETEEEFDYEALIAELNDIASAEPTEVILSDYIDEPEDDTDDVEDDYIPTHGAPEVEEEVEPEVEPEVEDSIVQEKDAEIEALKRRLAELMGEPVAEPLTEESLEVEELVEEEPAIEAEPVIVAETVAEPEVVIEAEPVVEVETTVEPESVVEAEYEPEVEAEETVEETVEETPSPVKDGSIVKHFNWFNSEVKEEVVEEEPIVEEESTVEEDLPLIDPTPETEEVLPLINEEHEDAVIADEIEEAAENDSTDAMSVEELEKDLFGEVADDEAEAEATKKIDKFYTLYKKNEEFQKLLDEEYNKLRRDEEEVVPTVSAILDEVENAVAEDAKGTEAVKNEVAAASAVAEKAESVAEETASVVEPVTKEDAVADKEASGKGGTALTIIAVIVAILLVILLAIILVLNFAPDSAIALKLDSIIEMITSYFSAVDVPGNFLL